mmetsp:Transcript_63217/g.165756  ORF Transcript_63217/g.165756 Transcript_63217/m.165756 type:complete len:446 (+) Transcript_63217:227-1564(+)
MATPNPISSRSDITTHSLAGGRAVRIDNVVAVALHGDTSVRTVHSGLRQNFQRAAICCLLWHVIAISETSPRGAQTAARSTTLTARQRHTRVSFGQGPKVLLHRADLWALLRQVHVFETKSLTVTLTCFELRALRCPRCLVHDLPQQSGQEVVVVATHSWRVRWTRRTQGALERGCPRGAHRYDGKVPRGDREHVPPEPSHGHCNLFVHIGEDVVREHGAVQGIISASLLVAPPGRAAIRLCLLGTWTVQPRQEPIRVAAHQELWREQLLHIFSADELLGCPSRSGPLSHVDDHLGDSGKLPASHELPAAYGKILAQFVVVEHGRKAELGHESLRPFFRRLLGPLGDEGGEVLDVHPRVVRERSSGQCCAPISFHTTRGLGENVTSGDVRIEAQGPCRAINSSGASNHPPAVGPRRVTLRLQTVLHERCVEVEKPSMNGRTDDQC